MGQMSDRLQAALSRGDDHSLIAVNIVLDSALDPSQVEPLLDQIAGQVADQGECEFLTRMKMAHCTATPKTVRRIANLAGVVWIDLESHAPLEEIMDNTDGV